ncbi:NUMOD4 domain-containing protein [Ruminiclostridium cellulolyticum]|uniref:NUMOD4 domain protein n=1 Tax=Ruminiclostridium cellulolyticum (strain ATCC 35319 / DSM 5812 / JCM 6584 / H10) TaxID=394503 RepID=B8I933_RUMCH|nr:NUMOD4 domain-containing protein [Ruminiclostridium cellulolyticum]ACL77365.1 NUMOD4 domain protein [Ruminiclostridium cellulolyticum H10]
MKKVPEYWVMVPGSEKYQVSNYGHFRRILKNGTTKPIKTYPKHNKWNVVKVDFYGKYAERVVHTIVASVFLDSPATPGLILHHKNGFKFDDYAGNLEWISRQDLGRITGGKTSRVIPVIKLDPKTGEVLNFYNSISSAARDNFIHKETICQVIRGQLKTAAGFGWRREEWGDFEGGD